jgi:hypothetical protein
MVASCWRTPTVLGAFGLTSGRDQHQLGSMERAPEAHDAVIVYTRAEWEAFAAGVRLGAFNF